MKDGSYDEAEDENSCVVVTIDRKLALDGLAAAERQPFPTELRTFVGERSFSIPVDVQASEAAVGKLLGLPARRLAVDGQHQGAVGLVVAAKDDGKQYVVTAGHVVAPWLAREVDSFQILGTNIRARMANPAQHLQYNNRYDQALLEPLEPLGHHPGRLPNNGVIAEVLSRKDVHKGARCRMFRVGEATPSFTIVRDRKADARFKEEWSGNIIQMSGLIAVRAVGRPGDSGSVLLDGALRIIGTLVGELGGKDYYCPCDEVLSFWGVKPV